MTTIIFAHRGASKHAPENTMPAFELAYEQNADGIETDIQLTKDNIPVLIHDETVNRTTNNTGYVANYTYKELQLLDAGSWFSRQFAGTKIISLDYFLQWIKAKKMLVNLELKTNVIAYKDIEHIVYQVIKKYDMFNQVVISSFNHRSIERFNEIDPSITTAFLTSSNRNNLIPFTRSLKASGLHINYRLLNPKLLKQANNNALYVGCYTVNRAHQMMRCYRLGCYVIFTDLPGVAVDTRELFEQNILN